MRLLDRLNLILDGEPLDGVGDNPDVLNRTIKQLVTILEAGDQSTLTVRNTNIKVNTTDFDISVEDGDFVYLNISTGKYTKLTPDKHKKNIGIADVTNLIIRTSGEYTYTGTNFIPGNVMYLDSVNAGKIVPEGNPNASDIKVGLALTSNKIIFNAGGITGFDLDNLEIGNVNTDDTQTLTNKTIISLTNNVASDYSHIKVVNRTALPFTKGQLVSFLAWDTPFNCPSVQLTDADIDGKLCIGMVNQAIGINETGEVITKGIITGLNTSALSENIDLYNSVVAGTYQTGKPYKNVQKIGKVVKSDTTTGSIYVNIQDVQESGNYKGDWVLGYDSGMGYMIGDIVTYTDDYYYTSKIDNNLSEPNGVTDGNWLKAERDLFPDQTGQSGKILTTNGTNVSWSSVDISSLLTDADIGSVVQPYDSTILKQSDISFIKKAMTSFYDYSFNGL